MNRSMAARAAEALERLPSLETWPRHFRRRALEMSAISRVFDFSSPKRTLELGCGNAFASALIADGRDQVVATDLYRESVDSHSIDLSRARRLLDGLGLPWCDVAAASGEALPFANGSFDLVFSLFVLEHVPNRAACLHEIRRVLAADGVTVHAVPGTMWALSAPCRFPFYLMSRVFARLRRRPPKPALSAPASGAAPADGTPALKKMTWSLFRERYPAFPLPPPHGSYRTYFEELLAYRRRAWVALFEQNGFDVLACAPLTILSPDVFVRTPDPLSGRLLAFDQWLASRRWLRVFGQFFVVIARSRSGETACP